MWCKCVVMRRLAAPLPLTMRSVSTRLNSVFMANAMAVLARSRYVVVNRSLMSFRNWKGMERLAFSSTRHRNVRPSSTW